MNYPRTTPVLSFICLLVAFVCSCHYCDHRTQILTDCKHKYWDAYWSTNDRLAAHIGCYRFSKNNTCYYFIWNRTKQKRILFDFGDGIPDMRWKFLENHKIKIMNGEFSILNFSMDSIRLRDNYDKAILTLFPSDNQQEKPQSFVDD